MQVDLFTYLFSLWKQYSRKELYKNNTNQHITKKHSTAMQLLVSITTGQQTVINIYDWAYEKGLETAN